MKPMFEHLPLDEEETFFAKEFSFPYFATPWHYHAEFELVLILGSEGKRFIGNHVSDFKKGDLSFFGPNLPHLYKNNQEYYDANSASRARSIVIHFREESLGKGLLTLPQSKKLNYLFELSKRGMDFSGETRELVARKMKKLLMEEGFNRLLCLLDILNTLANTSESELISEPGIIGHNAMDTGRLDRVFQFLLKNYQKDIDLEEIASLVHMTRTSFCRFFQERTKRTFSSVLIDVRLNNASQMLRESNENILNVSAECGYNSLSNFNRQFKRKYNFSPSQYRRLYSKH